MGSCRAVDKCVGLVAKAHVLRQPLTLASPGKSIWLSEYKVLPVNITLNPAP